MSKQNTMHESNHKIKVGKNVFDVTISCYLLTLDDKQIELTKYEEYVPSILFEYLINKFLTN